MECPQSADRLICRPVTGPIDNHRVLLRIYYSQILVAQGHMIEGIRLLRSGGVGFLHMLVQDHHIGHSNLMCCSARRNMTAFWLVPVAGFIVLAMQMLAIFKSSALPALVGRPARGRCSGQ